ncbi:peptide-N-glycosidase F-related protein [Solitalea koreensis]|uniref:Peptide-N-glycosidase F, C terminal n=1 Tax=Solitalea koreensis TaxID=543615 RepID=A0A521DYH6_9SPHI|nr:peptide-N-glycosidase F-related protein [Solitalea koreensis]SMO76672.1 Peptide-N-glycosidase F, C terminal [Solitalea koreensis]
MKKLLILLSLVLSISCYAQKKQIIHVVSHNRTTVICDTKMSGNNPYPSWGIFPSESTPVRKITMKVTLGSPDSLRTAHWDYLDHIYLRRKGGLNGKMINYEIGRMLTPYGSIYNKGWNWTWKVDVTDFAPLLRDSVEVVYVHSGYEDKTVGWALTIDFEILSGPSVVRSLGITPLWNGAFKYGDPNYNIVDSLRPISYVAPTGTAISRIRIQHTGHGMDRPKGCSEFCSRWRELSMDGKLVDRRDMWKKCGGNPLYPQGGTWVYSRAYWCPGDLQVPDIIDVPASAGKHAASIMMEPYTATGNIQAEENISAYMFCYSSPLQKTDVALEQILVPTDEQQFKRLNPACFNPRFLIRNLGSHNLRSLTITCGTDGFSKRVYHWKGNLEFNKTTEIVLNEPVQFKQGKNRYTVTLSKPNGVADAWMGDNELTTTFIAPELYPTNFVLQFRTNNRPKDNTVFLIDALGNTLFHKGPQDLDAATLYQDTIRLKEGKYELCLIDTAGNGLEFWAEPKNGDGYLRMFDMKGNLIHTFESDCGDGEKLSFVATPNFVADTTQAKYAFSLYPRVVTSNTEFSVVSNKTSEMKVVFTVDGKVYQQHEYSAIKNGTFNYNLDDLPDGRILMEVFINGKSHFKGRINKRKPKMS